MSSKIIIVPGASGQIGMFAIPMLLAAGFGVYAVSRKPQPSWYPDFEDVHWLRPEAMTSPELSRVYGLLSAGPIRVASELVASCPQLERAVVFSTSSVFSKLESQDWREKRQMQDILMEEAGLSHQCEKRGISLCLFRPTLIYGCGVDGNVSWLAKWIERFGFVPVAGKARGLRQPVHAEDLAAASVSALAHATPISLDVPLCGGSTLSFRDMVVKVFEVLDRPVRTISIPTGLFIALLRIARLFLGLRNVRPEMVRREGKDLVFDDSTARRELAYSPRVFAPKRSDLALPSSDYLIRLAKSGNSP